MRHRGHAAHQNDVVDVVVIGHEGPRPQTRVGPHDALAAAAVPDPSDAARVDVPIEHPALDHVLVANDVVGVRERRRGRGFDARPSVVLVAHHDVAVRSHVIADVVVPGVVVAVAVAHHDQRKLTHRRNVGWVVRILAQPRTAAVDDLCHSQRPSLRGVAHDIQAGFGAEPVDIVAVAKQAVLVAIQHRVVAHTQPDARVGIKLGGGRYGEGIILNRGSPQGLCLRAAGRHIHQRRVN